MRRKTLTFLLFLPLAVHAQFHADVETGLVFSSPYNIIRVPNAGGTTLDLATDLETQRTLFYRLRAGYTFGKRHTVSVLFAPLSVDSKGVLNKDVLYDNERFAAGTDLTGTFKFNTYRLTYRYELVRNNRFRLGVGLTGLVRDAAVRLRDENQSRTFDNFGVVPLLHYNLWWNPARRLLVLSEADASYARQGQAFDVFAGVGYRFSERLAAKAGYRVIQGGANVERTYTFSWLNFASVGLVYTPNLEKE